MRKAALTKDKDYALQNGDHERASELDSQLLELEAKAEDAEKRRYEGGASSISAVSFINNRNRKNNVIKAEMAIKEEIKRKELEGVEANPFTRRKCNPRMVTKKEEAAMTASAMTSELLKKMAEEQQSNKEKEGEENSGNGKDAPEEGVDNGADATDGEPAKKKAKTAAAAAEGGGTGSNGKEDLFSYHDFDIDIPGKCRIQIEGEKMS